MGGIGQCSILNSTDNIRMAHMANGINNENPISINRHITIGTPNKASGSTGRAVKKNTTCLLTGGEKP